VYDISFNGREKITALLCNELSSVLLGGGPGLAALETRFNQEVENMQDSTTTNLLMIKRRNPACRHFEDKKREGTEVVTLKDHEWTERRDILAVKTIDVDNLAL